jgi:hypothetical protein
MNFLALRVVIRSKHAIIEMAGFGFTVIGIGPEPGNPRLFTALTTNVGVPGAFQFKLTGFEVEPGTNVSLPLPICKVKVAGDASMAEVWCW